MVPIKLLYCNPDTEYLENLGGAFSRLADILPEAEEARDFEKQNSREFDFHGVNNYYSALTALIKANFEGRPTAGFYSELPFHFFLCYVQPQPSPRKRNVDLDGWHVLDQINNKLNLGASGLLERFDGTEIYRPPLCSIALLDPKQKTAEVIERLMSLRVFKILPPLMQVEELKAHLRQIYQQFFDGVSKVHIGQDAPKSTKDKEATSVRQLVRWTSIDEDRESYHGIMVDQLNPEDLEARGIELGSFQGKLKDLFLTEPKFRELSLKLSRRRTLT